MKCYIVLLFILLCYSIFECVICSIVLSSMIIVIAYKVDYVSFFVRKAFLVSCFSSFHYIYFLLEIFYIVSYWL